jgi:S1-C subfamily serine protease
MAGTANSGALVEGVIPGSAAEKAGFESGDLIVSVGNEKVSSANQLRLAIAQTSPGTRIPVAILRNEVKKTLFVTLELFGKPPPIPGISLEPLSSENREKYGIPAQTRGVVVKKSSGEAETFKEGVVIVEINGYQVNSIEEVTAELKKGINRFYVWYRGKYRFLAYRVP